MKNKTYLKLQIKKAFFSYPAILIITLITVLSIAVTCGVVLYNKSQSKEKTKLNVGLVGDMNNSYLELGLFALENFDSSRYTIEFKTFEEEEAKTALENHEISGYIRISNRFINAIMRGNRGSVEYVLLGDSTEFETMLMTEFSDIVSDWIVRAQTSVYAMEMLTKDYGEDEAKEKLSKNFNDMNIMYAEDILGRSKTYETKVLGISDSLSFGAYYLCAIIMFFLLIWPISCNTLFINKDLSLGKLLYAKNMKTKTQIASEYSGYFAVTLVTLIIFSFIFGIVLSNNSFGINELKGASFLGCVLFVFKMLPVVLMLTLFQMMLYELTPNTVGAIVLQFFVAIFLSYVSGILYPDFFFPELVKKISYFLPSGLGFSYLKGLLAGTFKTEAFILMLLYAFAFFNITVIIRNKKMAGDKL